MFTDLHPKSSLRINGATTAVFTAWTDKTLYYILYVTGEILPARTSMCSLLTQGERSVANYTLLTHGEMGGAVKW